MNEFLVSIGLSVVAIGLVQGVAGGLIFVERRLCAFIQDRLGPNRVGPQGILQVLADGVKLFFKEDIIPAQVDKPLYALAPAVMAIPTLSIFSVIPLTDTLELFGYRVTFQLSKVNVGLLVILAMSTVSIFGIVLGGWASNNKYSTLGGLRSAAQLISYEVTLALSVVGVVMLASSLELSRIVEAQSRTILGIIPLWNILLQPLGFILFLIAILAEMNRLPFDLTECEQELVGGYHTEYSSMKFAMFFLAEYAAVFSFSALTTVLFLGGWHLPILDTLTLAPLAKALVQIGVFAGKTALVIALLIFIRWTYPRVRYDQLMRLGWKVLLPLALFNIVATAVLLPIIRGAVG